MKFTLKDFQEEAVRDSLANLAKARKRWKVDHDKHAFSLTAPTGAGKTVMAGAVLEALFHGDDNYEFDADKGAVVIWFSDSPSLNEQTRFRLIGSSDRISHTDLIVVENTFNRPRLDPGKIYFLNTQKLGKKSLLVRGFDSDEEDRQGTLPDSRPDLRSHAIWDTVRNTIEDPALTLYLLLDEAHRGMGEANGAAQKERTTLVKRLINGERGVPGIPVVMGISATIDRFNQAMEGAKGRSTLPEVKVDASRVQDSGLLKDTIALDIPDEAGKFDTVLVRRATEKLKESNAEWAAYAKQQDSGTAVVPLMVLQVPNTPSPKDVALWLDTIFDRWPELPVSSVAHVLGEHGAQTFGRYGVPYIEPERVEESEWVRVLIAKEAISTGWDCPRAEVMVSLRTAKDHTHIAQLLGRMVRTPLARRIPGNDRLNTVDCLLPYFHEDTVKDVVKALTEGGSHTPPVGRVLVNPVELKPNPAVPAVVWKKFTSLPSQTRPQRWAKPAIRLTSLAQELVMDELLDDAGQKAHETLHNALDEFVDARSKEFARARDSIMTVEGRTVIVNLNDQTRELLSFETEGDTIVVNDAFRRSARIISPDIARTYTEVRAKRMPEAAEDFEGALIEAREDIAALHLMRDLSDEFDAAAQKLSNTWLLEYRERIKDLSDDRQEAYRQITALSREPQDVDLAHPVSCIEATGVMENGGQEIRFPKYENHLLCDEAGLYPANLAGWERSVLETESNRPDFKFWYRNPGRPTQESLGIAYLEGDDTKMLRPDFLFFAEASDGEIVVDIVDPHGTYLADSLAKLRGLARYAEAHAMTFRRVEAVAQVGKDLRVLDLTSREVRVAIASAPNAQHVYEGPLARMYGRR